MIKILHLLVKWFHNNSLQQISHYFSLSQSLKILFNSDVKSDGKQNYCDKFLLCKILRLVIIDRHHILTVNTTIFPHQEINAIKKENSFLVYKNHISVSLDQTH